MDIKLMSRCFHCFKAPNIKGLPDDSWVISCHGVSVTGNSYEEAIMGWNIEMCRYAAGLVA